MKTDYDNAATWFLREIVYHDSALRILVAEGIKSTEPEDLIIGEVVLGESYALTVEPESRLFCIVFRHPIAWQLIDESFTAHDSYEQSDEGLLSKFSRSRYLDHINQHHGWYQDLKIPATHYRVWTENEVIDVIARYDPVIEPRTSSTDTSC